jgi:hypothetical protein
VLDRVEGYREWFSPTGGWQRGSGNAGGGGGVGSNNNDDDIWGASTRAWRDRAASQGWEANGTVTCANCCSTLGYASDRDPVWGEPSVGVESTGLTPSLYYNLPGQL